MKTVAIYLRVSTGEQNTANQMMDLQSRVDKEGWGIFRVYEDAGVSGARGRDKRPQLDAMLKDAVRRKFDLVMAWSVCRLGRSTLDLLTYLGDLHAVNCGLYLHKQALDTTTPSGKMMFGMLGLVAEFERAMIQERVKAGLARAVANGVVLGRKRISKDIEGKIIKLRCSVEPSMGIMKIAKTLKLGTGTVHRIIKENNI